MVEQTFVFSILISLCMLLCKCAFYTLKNSVWFSSSEYDPMCRCFAVPYRDWQEQEHAVHMVFIRGKGKQGRKEGCFVCKVLTGALCCKSLYWPCVLFVQIFGDTPSSAPGSTNMQPHLARRRSAESKAPSCSERPLTLFHTPTHSHKGELDPSAWFLK